MTFSRTHMCALMAILLATVGRADAQPTLRAVSFPLANAAGWHNGWVQVRFFCEPGQACPEPRVISTEGRDQAVIGSLRDADGQETRASVSLNVDRTAPRVQIAAPASGFVTRDASIQVVAHAADALSGVTSATCGGVPAAVDDRGDIRCVVSLAPGINELVVEATDRADNSASMGIRVTRVGNTSRLRVVPNVAGILIGRPRTLQVWDEYGPVQDVTWRVDNPVIAEMADDINLLTPKAAGVVTVTATHAGVSASAVVTVYQGDGLPIGATRWRSGPRGVIQAFPPPPAGTDLKQDPPTLAVDTVLGQTPLVSATDTANGAMLWSETPAISVAETSASIHGHAIGGVLLVVEGRDGAGSSLVRGGPSAVGAPWRYRSAGRLAHELVQDASGQIEMVEVRANGFPELIVLDGRTGAVLARSPFVPGLEVALNVHCVAGANAVRFVAAHAGTPKVDASGTVAVEMVTTDDLKDYGVCGQVSGRLRRTIDLVTMRPGGPSVQRLGQFESPAGSPAPAIALLPVANDGHGGFLAPWTIDTSNGTPPTPRLTHVTAEGVLEEFTLPVAGEIVRWNDLASMTDGTTLVTFKAATGEIKWTRVFPGGGIRILPGSTNGTIYVASRTRETLDEFGRPVK